MGKIVKYKEEDMNKVLQILDRIEVKGFSNISAILSISQIIQNAIDIVEEVEEEVVTPIEN